MLADGRRIALDDQGGYTTGARWSSRTRKEVEDAVRAIVGPDDDGDPEEGSTGRAGALVPPGAALVRVQKRLVPIFGQLR